MCIRDRAYDAADLLLLGHARALFDEGVSGSAEVAHGGLVVIGDRHGALTLGASHTLGATGIRVHQDALLSERALTANFARLELGTDPTSIFSHHPLGEQLLSGCLLYTSRCV